LWGFVTCQATQTYQQANDTHKPFISLIGWLPPAPFLQPGTPNNPFTGCVNLQLIDEDLDRVNWLVQNNRAQDRQHVGLLCDSVTPMQQQERLSWTGGAVVLTQNFTQDFNDFVTAGMQAVVISGSPNFHGSIESLINAANHSGLFVCYPLQSYANSGGTQPHNAVLIGPDLVRQDNQGAYFLLGQMASTVLAGNAPPNPVVPVPVPPPTVLP
jgi:hypothetical protein